MSENAPALPQRRATFLECPIDLLTMDESVRIAEQAITQRATKIHVAMNVAKLVAMRQDPNLRQDVCTSDIVNVDGMGVVWGARMLGIPVPTRVAGIDLMHALLRLCNDNGYRPYLLGARQDVLDKVVRELAVRYPALRIAGCRNGYFAQDQEAEIVREIREARPDCLFVAMSSPLKERFNRKYARDLGVPFVMGIGGSLDVIAGKVRRAPPWMQKIGLEWGYRLAQEPRRMWRRYLKTNGAFALLICRELLRRSARIFDLPFPRGHRARLARPPGWPEHGS
jgi:N-acetylglucosaminyldiphosphoundecaprenol N-acetyl-beta-D-mannosaminyltransferase